MKKQLSIHQPIADTNAVVLLLRVTIAGLMLTHGVPKLVSLLSGNVQFPPILGLGSELSLGLAVFAEVICSLCILFGIGTRLATIPLIITMLVAAFVFHSADPFAKKELAILYLLSYVILFIKGSGKYSVDYILQKKPVQPAYRTTAIEDPTLSFYNR